MVMVTKKRPKPRTHSTRPMASSCQNKLSAWVLNDFLSACRAARISALIIRLGRVPLYRTKMMGMARTGVMIVTIGSADPHDQRQDYLHMAKPHRHKSRLLDRKLSTMIGATNTLIAPGIEGKMVQKYRLLKLEISEIMIFCNKNNPVMPRM